MVLGLRLAELANSSGHPFSVDVPAAHLPWPWPAVIGLWLLNHKEAGIDEPKELQEDDADVHHTARASFHPIKLRERTADILSVRA